jgi:hypothetical protein
MGGMRMSVRVVQYFQSLLTFSSLKRNASFIVEGRNEMRKSMGRLTCASVLSL